MTNIFFIKIINKTLIKENEGKLEELFEIQIFKCK